MSRDREPVEITARLVRETSPDVKRFGAYLIDDGDQEVWLPKSQVDFDGVNNFTMPEWLAREKGLI